jgi:hypothetical protein
VRSLATVLSLPTSPCVPFAPLPSVGLTPSLVAGSHTRRDARAKEGHGRRAQHRRANGGEGSKGDEVAFEVGVRAVEAPVRVRSRHGFEMDGVLFEVRGRCAGAHAKCAHSK